MPNKNSNPVHWVIIPAAGVGSRMAADRPKQYLPLLSQTVIERTLQSFLVFPEFEHIYVGISERDGYWPELARAQSPRVNAFIGGVERVDTVLRGLQAIEALVDETDWVWVHDAARPDLSHSDVIRMLAVIDEEGSDSAVLAAPIVDTVKRCDSDGNAEATVDRTNLWRAMTPQVFKYRDLRAALEYCLLHKLVVTDESSAMECCGHRPRLVPARGTNIKITRPGDLERVVNDMKSTAEQGVPRIGSGFDVHAFESGAKVTLGGVCIPHNKSLKAHSDGDVVLHALMDALLGALALGDIGKHFPDTDKKWQGADSRMLLREVAALVQAQRYVIGNIDLTVMAERPKLSPHISDMVACIAKDLLLDYSQVSVKATTTEKLGFTGREEGIACQATVLLMPESSR